MEETKKYHLRYLRAVNNPLRRKILRALEEGCASIDTLQSRTCLDPRALEWHLGILEHGFCVEREVRNEKTLYKLTQEGEVVDYIDD
jgi:DNA-binding transcriptional ArsR family regulator